MSGTDSGRPRIGFCFHPAAHYRQSLIEHLQSDSRLDIEFLFDERRSRMNLKHVSVASIKNFVRVPFIMAGGLVWQKGVVRRFLLGRYDAMLMTGDMHDLSTWVVLLLARLKRMPVVLWSQGWRRQERGLKGFVRRKFYSLSTELLVYGHRAWEIGKAVGFPEQKMRVTFNSVPDSTAAAIDLPPSTLDYLATELGVDMSMPRVLFASRMKRIKNPGLIVEAARYLAEEGQPVQLLFVGDGAEREALERAAERYGVRAHFFGSVYDTERLAEIYGLATCAVLPEHAGLAVIHALQHGVPVVVNDDVVGNNPEAEAVVPTVTGETYQSGSVPDLARALLAASAMHNDAAVRANCRRMATDVWSARNQARIMAETLLRVTSSAGRE